MFFDGVEVKKSAKGIDFATIYLRSIKEDGTADFKQEKFNTFNPEVISSCRKLKQNDIISVDITIRDGLIETIQEN